MRALTAGSPKRPPSTTWRLDMLWETREPDFLAEDNEDRGGMVAVVLALFSTVAIAIAFTCVVALVAFPYWFR